MIATTEALPSLTMAIGMSIFMYVTCAGVLNAFYFGFVDKHTFPNKFLVAIIWNIALLIIVIACTILLHNAAWVDYRNSLRLR